MTQLHSTGPLSMMALAACTAADRTDLADATRVAWRLPPAAGIAFASAAAPGAADAIAALVAQGEAVIALATRAQTRARLAAIEAGAFDLLTSGPVIPAELAARMRLAATGSALPAAVTLDGQHLTLDGTGHALTPREAEILAMLLEARGHAVPHAALLALWGEHASERQYLRVAIAKLRRKIEPEPDLPRYLLSEPAIGYRMGLGLPARPHG